jgi:hypothetical protein
MISKQNNVEKLLRFDVTWAHKQMPGMLSERHTRRTGYLLKPAQQEFLDWIDRPDTFPFRKLLVTVI